MISQEEIEQEERWTEEAARALDQHIGDASASALYADLELERLHRLNDVELFDGAEGSDAQRLLREAMFSLRQARRIVEARLELLGEEAGEAEGGGAS